MTEKDGQKQSFLFLWDSKWPPSDKGVYAFVLLADLCFAEHCYVACCYQVVQNNSNDGINSCKACNTSNLHTL